MPLIRQRPPCPHAPTCVPCPFRGLPYREQLARKRRAVIDAVAEYPALSGAAIEEVIGSRDLFGYRNLVKLAIRARRDGRLRAGVYEPGSHRLADAAGCAVHHPAINGILAATLEEATRLRIPAYDERTQTGELRYVVARWSAFTRRVLLILVTKSRHTEGLRELSRRLPRLCRELGGIVQNVNPDPGNVILGREWATLRPPAFATERIGFVRLQTSPGAFLQANVWTARRIYETVVEGLAPGAQDVVIDVYCGVGPLTLHLARHARLVIGVEEIPEAVRDAKSNARRNGIANTRFRTGLAEDVLPGLGEELGGVSLASLNPPRKGARSEALDALVRLEPRRIAYVSCDPRTLARDLDRLAKLGYRTLALTPFDMLPQTEHVEVVALTEANAS